MSVGRLAARVTIGGLFVGHGTQKLFGWFGGPGAHGAAPMMHKVALGPGGRHPRCARGAATPLAAGASEAAGGAMLALGALTPAAGALLTGPMFTAIRKVHFQ